MKRSLAGLGLAFVLLAGCDGDSNDLAAQVPGGRAGGQAVNDSYSTLGRISVAIPAETGLLANDAPGSTAIKQTLTTLRGGTAEIQGDGSFLYTPPATSTKGEADRFSYRLTSGETANVDVPLPKDLYVVDVTAASGGDGTEAHPFQTIDQAVKVATRPDIIYLIYNANIPHVYQGTLPPVALVQGQGIPLSFADGVVIRPAVGYSRLQGTGIKATETAFIGMQFEHCPLSFTSPTPNDATIPGVGNCRFLQVSGNAIEITDRVEAAVSYNEFIADSGAPGYAVHYTGIDVNGIGGQFRGMRLVQNKVTRGGGGVAYTGLLKVDATAKSYVYVDAKDNNTDVTGSHFDLRQMDNSQLIAHVSNNTMTHGTAAATFANGSGGKVGDGYNPSGVLRAVSNKVSDVESGFVVTSLGSGIGGEYLDNEITGVRDTAILFERWGSGALYASLARNVIKSQQVGVAVSSNGPGGPGPVQAIGIDEVALDGNDITAPTLSVGLDLFSGYSTTVLVGNSTSSGMDLKIDSDQITGEPTSMLLRQNVALGPIFVTVDPGFTLELDASTQITPKPTLGGGGVIVQ